MKFVRDLTLEQQQELQALVKSSPTFRVRQRAHAILLSARGYAIDALADIFSAHRNTISEWIDAWEDSGVDSLEDAPRSGRPPLLGPDGEKVLLDALEINPRSVTQAIRAVKKRSAR